MNESKWTNGGDLRFGFMRTLLFIHSHSVTCNFGIISTFFFSKLHGMGRVLNTPSQ